MTYFAKTSARAGGIALGGCACGCGGKCGGAQAMGCSSCSGCDRGLGFIDSVMDEAKRISGGSIGDTAAKLAAEAARQAERAKAAAQQGLAALDPVPSPRAAELVQQLNRFANSTSHRFFAPLDPAATAITPPIAMATLTVLIHRFREPQAVADPSMSTVLSALGSAYASPTASVARRAGEYIGWVKGYADRLGLPDPSGRSPNRRPISLGQIAILGGAALLVLKGIAR